jgi:hypothetical protein
MTLPALSGQAVVLGYELTYKPLKSQYIIDLQCQNSFLIPAKEYIDRHHLLVRPRLGQPYLDQLYNRPYFQATSND